MVQKKLLKRLVVPIVLGIITYSCMLFYGEGTAVLSALKSFDWKFIPFILLLSYLNYLLRFLKWEYYLRVIEAGDIPRGRNFHIFMSGLSLAITPGKIGEVIKPYLLKAANGTRMSRSLPVVVAERFTDLTAIVVLSSFGVMTLRYGLQLLVFSVALIVAIFLVIGSRRICDFLLSKASRIPLFRRLECRLEPSYDSMHKLLSWKALAYPVALSLFAWFFECLGLFLALHGYETPISLRAVTFAYSFSTLVGGISFFPGGIGATEASMAALLIFQKVPQDIDLSGTIIIRC